MPVVSTSTTAKVASRSFSDMVRFPDR